MADKKAAIIEEVKRTSVENAKSIAPAEIFRLIKQTVFAWYEDNAASMGAAIAFYTIFSVAPVFIIALAVSGFVFGTEAAQGLIFTETRSVLGEDIALTLQTLVENARQPTQSTFAAMIGAVAMALGASAVFSELQSAMDRIWRTPLSPHQSTFGYIIRRRMFTFGMVTGAAFVMLVSFMLSVFIASLQRFWKPLFGGSSQLFLQLVELGVSFMVVTGMFALIFKLVPRVRVTWNDVFIGAVVTSLLFNLGKFLIGLYIGSSGIISVYGAAGTMIALLLWVYYSAQIFLLGAEFTWLYANTYGSRSRPD